MPYLDGLPPATSVSPSDIVAIDQGGTPGVAGTATTRRVPLSLLLNGGGSAITGLTATGTTQGTALPLPISGINGFSTVASGTGTVIPSGAGAGEIFDVWNSGANNLPVYPMVGGQIETYGTNIPVFVGVGGRATFLVASRTQVYVR